MWALVLSLVLPGASLALNKDPIVFVHGLGGSTSDFDDMRTFFTTNYATRDDDGIVHMTLDESSWDVTELYTFGYESCWDSMNTAASDLNTMINNIITTTGKPRVDIIAYSLGSVVSRYYLKKYPDAKNKVDAWISLAGPNHGVDGWDFLWMCSLFGCTGACAMNPNGNVITYLDSEADGGQTPQNLYWDPINCEWYWFPRYFTVRSEADTVAVLNGSSIEAVHLWVLTTHNVLTDTWLSTYPEEWRVSIPHTEFLDSKNTTFWQHLMYYAYLHNFVPGHPGFKD
jgi:triacylglycerol lipase